MPSKIRCKFILSGHKNSGTQDEPMIDLRFDAVYSEDPNNENSKWWKWTPSGTLYLQTLNPAVLDVVSAGKEYYIDIIPVEN